MADATPIIKGSARTIAATYTDKDDVAAVPTDAKLEFIPPSGSSNKTVYAKNPGAGEQTLTFASNVGSASHVFDESGYWDVVAYGLTNMNEVKPVRVFVEDAPA